MARVGETFFCAQLDGVLDAPRGNAQGKGAAQHRQEGGGTLSPTRGMVAKLSKEAMSTCTMVTRRALTLRPPDR